MVSADNYIRKVLMANGIGNMVIGFMLIFTSNQLANFLGFPFTVELAYVAGGWGVADFLFGLLRFFTGLRQSKEMCWFVSAIGLFEGAALACFGLFLIVETKLTFFQVSPSTLFAFFFLLAYGIGFYLRSVHAQ